MYVKIIFRLSFWPNKKRINDWWLIYVVQFQNFNRNHLALQRYSQKTYQKKTYVFSLSIFSHNRFAEICLQATNKGGDHTKLLFSWNFKLMTKTWIKFQLISMFYIPGWLVTIFIMFGLLIEFNYNFVFLCLSIISEIVGVLRK